MHSKGYFKSHFILKYKQIVRCSIIYLLFYIKTIKQLNLGNVFKIEEKTCPHYLSTNFQQLNEGENRITTRAKANNFYKPKKCRNTVTYSDIDEWNSLPNNIKAIQN